MIRAILIQAGADPTWIEHGEELADFQKTVGGYIEKVPIPGRPDLALLVDEDGRMKLDPYFAANAEASMACQREIVGTALLVGVEGAEIVSAEPGDLFPYDIG